MSFDAGTLLALAAIGLAAGILSGFVGIGGGVIMVPAMVLLLGYEQHQAQGTSLAVLMLPVVALAVRNYYKAGVIDPKVVAVIAVAFVAGGYFGSRWALMLPPETVKRVFGVLMVVVAFKLIFGK
jgi:uncharacterized membrane protein YfcA